MQLVDDKGIFLPPVMRNPHISVVGLTVTSDTLKAPRKGWPLRLSSFLEMLKQGTPFIDVTSASAIRDIADVSRDIKHRFVINIVAWKVFRAFPIFKEITEHLFIQW